MGARGAIWPGLIQSSQKLGPQPDPDEHDGSAASESLGPDACPMPRSSWATVTLRTQRDPGVEPGQGYRPHTLVMTLT